MCLTLESDYALRIVGCLAEGSARKDARLISEQTGVTLRFALKILRKLVSGGIVCSFKGMQGGYELARPADQITLYDVVSVIEGDFHLNKCHEDDFVCTRTSKACCFYRPVFEEISDIVIEKLSSHSFADIIGD